MICSKCGKPGPHYVVPSLGESGFFICDPEVIQQPYDKDMTMSTNCIRCVTNCRTGHDLLCDECRAKKSSAAAPPPPTPTYIPAEQLEPGKDYSARPVREVSREPVTVISREMLDPMKSLYLRPVSDFTEFLPLDLTASVPELRERIAVLEMLLNRSYCAIGIVGKNQQLIEDILAALAASREGRK